MIPELSNREREVVDLLRQGKSNKLIALALGISERTVEFHLKNIYAKYQVNTRLELVLRLEQEDKLGVSTVEETGETTENRNRSTSWMNWTANLKNTVSKIGREWKMDRVVNPSGSTTVTFMDAIRICLAKYADFSGRASRAEFWWFFLFVLLVASALTLLHEVLGSIFLIAVLLPLLAVGTRRLRDSGKSGWWQLFLLVPVGGIVALGFLWAEPPVSELPEETTVL